jgi:hypothetical protein
MVLTENGPHGKVYRLRNGKLKHQENPSVRAIQKDWLIMRLNIYTKIKVIPETKIEIAKA